MFSFGVDNLHLFRFGWGKSEILLVGLWCIECGSTPSFQVWPLFLFINSQKGHIPDLRLPSAFPNLPLFPSMSALSLLFPPNSCYPFLLPLLFAPDQLIMSGKEGHYPEVISWVLSGWCISPAWWRNTLIPGRLSFSFPPSTKGENDHRMLLKCTAAKANLSGKQTRMSHTVDVSAPVEYFVNQFNQIFQPFIDYCYYYSDKTYVCSIFSMTLLESVADGLLLLSGTKSQKSVLPETLANGSHCGERRTTVFPPMVLVFCPTLEMHSRHITGRSLLNICS